MKLKSIQCLRGVAVLLVSYSHAINLQSEFSISIQQNFFYLAKFGAIGADVFFVISGFIISYVTSKLYGLRQGIHFLHKRVMRIYPIYYLITFVQIGLFYFFIPDFQVGSVIQSLRDSLILIPLINNQSVIPIIKTAWTLEFEWYFYIVLFILIIIKVKNKAIGTLVVMGVILFIGRIITLTDFRWRMLSNPIMLEFLFGVVIYILYVKVRPVKSICYFIFMLAILAAYYNIFFGYPEKLPALSAVFLEDSGLQRAILWGIPSAFIVGSCIFIEKLKIKGLSFDNPIMQLIGNASYSIYLLNLPLEFLLHSVYKRMFFSLPGDVAIFFHLVVYVGVGIIFYLVIERYLLKITIQGN